MPSTDSTQSKKESMNLKTGQQKLPKLKCKEKKEWKKNPQIPKPLEQNIQELQDNFKRNNICIIGILEGEDRMKKNI